MVSGPRPVAIFEGRRIGTGTDLWRLWDQRRAGEISDARWADLEGVLTLGKGTCNTMGTASTMGAIAEALGLAWPGSTSIPAGDPRHFEIAHRIGERSVELVREGRSVSTQVSPEAIANALVVLCAIGGSTNAVIHLTAMARRLGHDVPLKDLDRISRSTPVLVDVEPSGSALMEDLDAAGGFPTLFKALGSRLNPDVVLANGETVMSTQSAARDAEGVVRDASDPVDDGGAFRVVSGNLAVDGALIKRSAATASLLSHSGPAYVIASYDELDERIGPNANCPEDAVLVFPGVGPVGGPGMPEWGMIPIPEPLIAKGVTDMVRITDARMSGTSFGTVFLHVAPEAAVGGAIGLVRDGDIIHVDADGGSIVLDVDDDELARRAARSTSPSGTSRGYAELYRHHVSQAPDGCDFDFLVQPRGQSPQRVEPVVGRS
jgi:dihydroxy-acid dehydratase